MNKIDLVIPMVFPQDPYWQAAYAAACGVPEETINNERFRSWNTEELLVRCCMKFMPWLRTIHILLASESQVQEWMKDPLPPFRGNGNVNANSQEPNVQCSTPKGSRAKRENKVAMFNVQSPQVRLCFHDQFIPAELLPTFNVNTIEMWLHRIPDLSEYFIYSNDDLFPMSALSPKDFFQPIGFNDNENVNDNGNVNGNGNGNGNGNNVQCSMFNVQWLPCQRMEEVPYPNSPNTYQKFVKHGLDMVAQDFGTSFPNTWLKGGHSMTPMLRSTVEKVCQRHRIQISNSFTLQRHASNYNQYIFPFYQHLSGKYIDYVPARRYIGPGVDTRDIPALAKDPNIGIVCFNDNQKLSDWKLRAEVVRNVIIKNLGI